MQKEGETSPTKGKEQKHLGLGEKNENVLPILERKLGEFNAQCHKNTEFYSTYLPHLIFEDLARKLYKDECVGSGKVNVNDKKWKMAVHFKAI